MPAITQFNDFMQSTGPAYLKSADAVINEAVKNNYVLSRLLKEKASETLIQSGTSIRDVIVFDDAATYQKYQPNDTFTWSNPQVTDTLSASWRFSMDHMAWTDQEVELNEGDPKTLYKRLKRVKEMRMWTSMLNGMENDLWAAPQGQGSAIESSSGREPYSIPCFVTEQLNSITTFGDRGGRPTGFGNTVLGIDPTVDARWTNQVSFYDRNADQNAAFTSAVMTNHNAGTRLIGGLFPAMDEMYLKVQFKAPLTQRQYFEETNFQRQMILCSRVGINQYKRALRAENDVLVNMQDAAYNTPTFSGIPLEYCANLDDAAIFPAHTSAVTDTLTGRNTPSAASTTVGQTETNANTIDKGPRYYFINGQYLTPIFHTTRYMKKHDVMRHPNQPFSWVQPVDCWWNLFCNSRQRHGIVSPVRRNDT